jgi:hypothetical protein
MTVQLGTAQAAIGSYGPIINSVGRGCVDVRTEDGINNFGAHVQNYHCTGAGEQQWIEQPIGNGDYLIINQRSGQCLDGDHGFWAVQWGCSYSSGQRWQEAWQSGMPSNAVQLRNENGQCLELTGANSSDHQLLSVTGCGFGWSQWWEIH